MELKDMGDVLAALREKFGENPIEHERRILYAVQQQIVENAALRDRIAVLEKAICNQFISKWVED